MNEVENISFFCHSESLLKQRQYRSSSELWSCLKACFHMWFTEEPLREEVIIRPLPPSIFHYPGNANDGREGAEKVTAWSALFLCVLSTHTEEDALEALKWKKCTPQWEDVWGSFLKKFDTVLSKTFAFREIWAAFIRRALWTGPRLHPLWSGVGVFPHPYLSRAYSASSSSSSSGPQLLFFSLPSVCHIYFSLPLTFCL